MQFKKIALALLVIATTTAKAQQAIVLNKGQKMELSSSMKVNTSFEAMGQQMENNTEATMHQVAEIKDNAGGKYAVSVTNDKMTVKVSAMGQEMEYDSDKKDQDGPLADQLKDVLKDKVEFSIDAATGKAESAAAKDAGAASPTLSSIQEKMKSLGCVKPMLLGKSFTKGQSWADSTSRNEGQLVIKLAGNFTVTDVVDNIAVIGFAGTEVTAGTMEQNGMEMNYNGTTKLTSLFKLDMKSGLVLEETTNGTVNASVSVMGQDIPITGTTVTVSTAKLL